MIERTFDVAFVASQAHREKQIQQSYRPVIGVHKWFARRPGSLFRSLLLSEFAEGDLRDTYFQSHDLAGLVVADPFMGGGTPLIEANRLGCNVLGYDINQMAYWVVREELESLDIEAYDTACAELTDHLLRQIGTLYTTKCECCGNPQAKVKYFIWVKQGMCNACGQTVDLFPGYLLASRGRHPKNVIICSSCGGLNEVDDRKHPGTCRACGAALRVAGLTNRGRFQCPTCRMVNRFPSPEQGPPQHRMVAIEYYCPACRTQHHGRYFKKPDASDLDKYHSAEALLNDLEPLFVPDDEIPPGEESSRLQRWGYRFYREMFNYRQLLGLELSSRIIATCSNPRVKRALITNLSDLLRYQNMLCRYDAVALKSLDVFSIHGYPVGLVQCESNLLGLSARSGGPSIGSGGWGNIVGKYRRAKKYCERPFETKWKADRKQVVFTSGERIGEHSVSGRKKTIDLRCGDSSKATLLSESLDAVFTDPPYLANVQYAELMDFCYVWLRRLANNDHPCFSKSSTRSLDELTENAHMGRDVADFAAGLSKVFGVFCDALKPEAPFAFTYHHNSLDAYYPIAMAILDTGLACSEVLPCPGEMSASVHINGTESSVIDSVFVCRKTRQAIKDGVGVPLNGRVKRDERLLEAAGLIPSDGDLRCIALGHLTMDAIHDLGVQWDNDRPTNAKLDEIEKYMIERWNSYLHEARPVLGKEASG